MIINSKQSLSDCIIELESDFDKYHHMQVKISKLDRTGAQNAWINLAYGMIGKQVKLTFAEVRRECKLNLGLYILFENDEDSASRWRKMMRCIPYEERLKAMDQISVSSMMDVDQGKRYIESIMIEYQHCRLPEKQN